MKRLIFSLLALAMACCLAPPASAADDLEFPESAGEIIGLLKGKEGIVQEINGVKYILSDNILYKIVGGKRWRVRGLAGVEAAEMMPRVGAMVLFETNSAEISERSLGLLSEFGKALSAPELKNANFMIEGHTDDVGETSYNQELSERRAEGVKSFLVSKFNIDPSRLSIVGLGESKPIAANTTADGKQRNRRVEMVRLLAE